MKFIYPRSITRLLFSWDYNARLCIKSMYTKSSEYKGKQLVFGFETSPSNDYMAPNPHCNLRRYPDCADTPFIYVAPEVSLSRDTLRNSGYKIVRSKEKATCTVVPDLKVISKFEYNIAVIGQTNDVYLFVHDGHSLKRDEPLNLVDELFERYFHTEDKSGYEFIYDTTLSEQKAYSIYPCEEYPNMWDDTQEPLDYTFESRLKLTPTTEVSPELFAIWSKCNDSDLIASAVLQTDWKTYPFTIAVFLRTKFPYIYHTASKALKHVLNEIGFFNLKDYSTSSMVVSPEDWNMLQKCQLSLLGLPETGGFIDPGKDVPDVLPHKMCVKPMYIDKPATFESLKTMVKV